MWKLRWSGGPVEVTSILFWKDVKGLLKHFYGDLKIQDSRQRTRFKINLFVKFTANISVNSKIHCQDLPRMNMKVIVWLLLGDIDVGLPEKSW